jgi:glycolate dehydrogenase FAD-binding subunit
VSALSRSAGEEDAVLGVRPEVVYEPSSVEEAAEILLESARSGKALVFVGGGTDLELGAPPARLDAVVRTRGLSRIVEHAPSDQIAVVEAGTPLAALQRALASHRQRLAIDPPLPERKTVGGIVAANVFGPRRARFGSIRDLILGVSLVRADGTAARGGGKVVKNVAGFDLPKLMVGSLGTLGLITTATFRLHPLPEEETTLLLTSLTASGVRSVVNGIRERQLEPSAVVAVWREGGRFDVAVRFEGFRASVAAQRDSLRDAFRSGPGDACDVLDAEAASRFWSGHDELRAAPSFRGKIAALSTHIEPIAAEVLPGLLAPLGDPGFLWYATLGLGFFGGSAEDPAAASRALLDARSRIAGLGGTLVLEAAPAAIRSRVDSWGPPPPALPLLRRMKERLDPERRLAPGRFVGGI